MYTLTGPTDKMQPETKVQLRPEDRPAPREEPSSESQGKVKVAPIRIRFLGERPSDVNSRIQQEIADGLWDADDDDAMDVGFVMIRYNQMENENERSLLGADFDKSDIITTFLAVLELLKYGRLHVEQEETFGNIMIYAVEGADYTPIDFKEDKDGEY